VKIICKCCREWKMVVRCKLGIEENVCVRDWRVRCVVYIEKTWLGLKERIR
jgi:hypothetical protein